MAKKYIKYEIQRLLSKQIDREREINGCWWETIQTWPKK